MQQLAGEALRLDSGLGQPAFQRRIDGDFGAAIAPRPEHRVGSRRMRNLRRYLAGAAAKKIEPPAARLDVPRERRQRMMQPPVRSAAVGAKTCARFVEDIYAKNGAPQAQAAASAALSPRRKSSRNQTMAGAKPVLPRVMSLPRPKYVIPPNGLASPWLRTWASPTSYAPLAPAPAIA